MYHMIYETLNVPVSASDDAVREALYSRLKPNANPHRVAQIESGVLKAHHDAGDLYRDVVGGRIG